MSDGDLRFRAGGADVELDAAAIASLGRSGPGESPWRLVAAPDWERYEALRLLAASFGDGAVTALVAMRPRGAAGHDAEEVSAVVVDPRKGPQSAGEALLSTELDAERHVRRVGVELWTSEEPPPRRFAADRRDSVIGASDGVEREAALMDARMDGESGTAIFEVLRPAP